MSAVGANSAVIPIDDLRLRKQIQRFLVVGGSSVAVDLLAYCVLLKCVDRMTAKGLAYLAGVLIGFAGNKLWTFESRQLSFSEPILYIVVYASTLVINIAINSLVCSYLESMMLASYTAQIWGFLFATGVTTVLNFVGLKFVAFRRAQLERTSYADDRTSN